MGLAAQVHDVWAKVGHTAKAHDVMSAELEAALEAPLAMHLGGETEKGRDSKEHSDDKLRETCNIHDDMSGALQLNSIAPYIKNTIHTPCTRPLIPSMMDLAAGVLRLPWKRHELSFMGVCRSICRARHMRSKKIAAYLEEDGNGSITWSEIHVISDVASS